MRRGKAIAQYDVRSGAIVNTFQSCEEATQKGWYGWIIPLSFSGVIFGNTI